MTTPAAEDPRLDQVDEQIDKTRDALAEETGIDEDEPRFNQRGTKEPVDDAIAPPG